MQVATQVDYLDSCKIKLEFEPNHTVRDYTAAVTEKKFLASLSPVVYLCIDLKKGYKVWSQVN
jgi:hypothetical protein